MCLEEAVLGIEWNNGWRDQGVTCISPPESRFSRADIEFLHKLADEWLEVGDADEPNRLEVGRFMTDVDEPVLVNRPLSDKALEIVKKPKYEKIYWSILDGEDVHVRRMQFNRIHGDEFVGYHLGIDSNPDYEAA